MADVAFKDKNKWRMFPLEDDTVAKQYLTPEELASLNTILTFASFNVYVSNYGTATNETASISWYDQLKDGRYIQKFIKYPIVKLKNIQYNTANFLLRCSLNDIADDSIELGMFTITIPANAEEGTKILINDSDFATNEDKRIHTGTLDGYVTVGNLATVNPQHFTHINMVLSQHAINFLLTSISWFKGHYITSLQVYNKNRKRQGYTAFGTATPGEYWTFFNSLYELKENVNNHSFIFTDGVITIDSGLNCNITVDKENNAFTVDSISSRFSSTISGNSTLSHPILGYYYDASEGSYQTESFAVADNTNLVSPSYNGTCSYNAITSINGTKGQILTINSPGLNVSYSTALINISLNSVVLGCN